MIKKLILKMFGRERIVFIRSKPFLIHGKYREIINEIETYSTIINKNYGTDPELSALLTRKFAHILDKGLHRSDVAPGHSKTIAKELEKNLHIIENEESELNSNDESISWAKQKLSIYNKLQETGKIDDLKEKTKIPIVDFETFFELIKARRSNRQFLEKAVSEEKLTKLAETVNWASSSCNKQPIKLFATNNPELAKQCLDQCKGGTGFSENIPCFIAFCADMRGYYLPAEIYLPHTDTGLGAQNFFLALNIFGLSGTGLTWAQKDIQEELELRRLLNIPEHYQIIFNAVIGYSSKNYLTPIRKSLINTLTIRK